jgi:hypothetical protein
MDGWFLPPMGRFGEVLWVEQAILQTHPLAIS